ncbi:hypothetical protein HZH68_017106 [Vespula germanica]|uniref:RNA-directed DNA polymerase n=1 Tax=Vespula germanica TaxID=30212 RepID=A0A834J594_VESGE|nr:hypothetical protein HZH68_017106 [Vespula germanica]
MSSDRTNQNQPKLADKIETRSDAEIEDITFRLRQKELFLQERERTIREREEILRSDTAKPDLATLETLLREIVTTRHQTDDAFYDSFESYNISIREAISMVPQYDGYNISIGTFTRACKRARELILFNAEETATRLIIKKLRGQVYSIVKDYNIYSIDRLCDILWENLCTQYKVELSNIYMDQDEHILEFIDRVKDLRQVICNEERYKSHELTEEKRKKIDEFILISFCHGLPLEYRLKITPDTCEDLLDAFVKARKFYAEIELDRFRYQEYQQPQDFRDRPTTSNCDETGIKNRNTRATNSNPAPKSCTYCNKLGHNKDECYKRKRKQQIRSEESLRRDYPFPLPAPPHRFQSNSHGPRKECRYCKNMGHTIEECRKKLWQDKNSGNPDSDDILIYSNFLNEHITKFKKLSDRLEKAGLKLQLDKCKPLRREVAYLISATEVKSKPEKIKAVKEFPRPRISKNVEQFLGLAGYYRRFISNFSSMSKPLTNLLKKDKPLLQYPEFTKPFAVTTDASNYAIGGILSQSEIGNSMHLKYRVYKAEKRSVNVVALSRNSVESYKQIFLDSQHQHSDNYT